MREAIELAGAEAIGTFDDGAVAATRHRVGAGGAMLIATCPSVAYDARRDPATRAALVALLGVELEAEAGPARWLEPAPGLMLRRHVAASGAALQFALNWTAQAQVLALAGAAELHALDVSRRLAPGATIEIPALAGALVVAR
jgi:beta-galactosidase